MALHANYLAGSSRHAMMICMTLHITIRLPGVLALITLACGVQAQGNLAPITAVTLYPGSATVQRTARVEAGATRLVVNEISTQFALPTLRVESDAGIRVGQVTMQDVARTESANAAEAALESRIQALKDQAAELDVKAGAADIVKGYLERAGGAPGAEHTSATLDGKALTGMVAAINQAATDALARKQQVAVQRRGIDKQIEALERDLKRVRSESRDSRTLVVQLTAERAGAVRLSYQVNSAGWRPAYRAELNSTASSVGIERLAQVSQKTGETWNGVRLSLSTVQPRTSPGATIASLRDQREICNRNSASSQVCWRTTQVGGLGSGVSASTTAAIDTSVAQDLIFYGQLANSSETITLESWLVELYSHA